MKLNKINESLTTSWRQEVAVDFGTGTTRVILKNRGVVYEEASLVTRLKQKRWVGVNAPRGGKNRVVAYGDRAKGMYHCEPKQLEVVAPIKHGIVADLEMAEYMALNVLQRVSEIPGNYFKLLKPKVMVAVPMVATEVEKRAVAKVFKTAGAGEVILVPNMIAASMQLGLKVTGGGAMMIADVGLGKSEVYVVMGGGVVVGSSSKNAAGDWDRAIINYLKMRHALEVGNNTAERLKRSKEQVTLVRGRDLGTNLPKSVMVSREEVNEATHLESAKIVKLVAGVLDQVPSELIDGIVSRGICLIGGGSNFSGLDKLISEKVSLPVLVDEEAERTTLRGLGKLLENKALLAEISAVDRY